MIPVKLTKATGVDKIIESQNYTLCAVKFVNPWHAVYLRRGKDQITYADNTTAEDIRHTQYMEKGELLNVVTSGMKQDKMVVAVRDKAGVAHTKRNALYLDYQVKVEGVATVATKDTMVVRNRGVVGEYFTVK